MQTLKYFHINIEANYCGADYDLYVSHTEDIKSDTILLNVLEEFLNNLSLETFGCCNYGHSCDYDDDNEEGDEVIIKATINEISKEEIEEENVITYNDFIKENFVY